jgi:hypothetical protein
MRIANLIFVGLISLLPLSSLCAQESTEKDSVQFAQITFEEAEYNFGDINQGKKVEKIFQFTNTGNLPLIIDNVLTTCGCTVPEWPKEPIAPKETGQIKVVFDSTAKIGRQNKVVTIRSNSKDGDARIRVSAMVLPPQKE